MASRSGPALVTILIAFLGFARVAGFAAPAVQYFVDVPAPAAPPGLLPYETVANLRPIEVTLTINWAKVRVPGTAEEFTSNPFYWRNMHFDDWDRLPEAIRNVALGRLLATSRHTAAGPAVWARLTAEDWDLVPQPLRAVVYPQMLAHWADVYGLTSLDALDPGDVLRTLSAVMMAESWFEHRGVNVNEWGNRDLGLGGCSDRCRRVLGEMGAKGDLDFVLAEDDYFNPWHATRALVVWFGLELARADGDLDVAVSAYHRGFRQAFDEKGQAYWRNVIRLRRTYFEGWNPSPTWRALRAWVSAGRVPTQAPVSRTSLPGSTLAARPDPGGAAASTR